MSDAINLVNEAIDEQHRDKSASTRRQMIGATGAMIGAAGLLSVPNAVAQIRPGGPNTPEAILNIAATAEVLATIVNTVGPEKVQLDPVTLANVRAAATEEKLHYEFLTGAVAKAVPLTKRIWVPDAVFASQTSLLTTLAVGDQVFVNAYLIGTTVFARAGGTTNAKFARISAEIMAVEAVHRALALQSLGKLGNDRVYAKFAQREDTPGLPNTGQPGFYDITEAPKILTAAGFGFGTQGATPGAFYDYDTVAARTPTPAQTGVNTLSPS